MHEQEPTYGGHRWWFLLGTNESGAPQRAAKLYLPPGGKYFKNRRAYGLTYQSCQESRKYDGLYRRVAAAVRMDVATVRFALKRL